MVCTLYFYENEIPMVMISTTYIYGYKTRDFIRILIHCHQYNEQSALYTGATASMIKVAIY